MYVYVCVMDRDIGTERQKYPDAAGERERRERGNGMERPLSPQGGVPAPGLECFPDVRLGYYAEEGGIR